MHELIKCFEEYHRYIKDLNKNAGMSSKEYGIKIQGRKRRK